MLGGIGYAFAWLLAPMAQAATVAVALLGVAVACVVIMLVRNRARRAVS